MFSFLKNLLMKERLDYTDLKERGVIIIDVRTPQEFQQGHMEGSINIPLNEIMDKIAKIKQFKKPIITCCRSGMRSAKAKTTLTKAGIEVYNGGSWNKVKSSMLA